MARIAWSDDENDLIVATYFAMLQLELAGKPYSKAEYNFSLRSKINRSRGSVEFKFENISAVLNILGMPWVKGYKPAKNIQKSLKSAVERWLAAHPDVFSGPKPNPVESSECLEETVPEWRGPPSRAFSKKAVGAAKTRKPTARKEDYAARDAANRDLGRAGELFVFEHEKTVLRKAGRADLAALVRHVSEEEGDGLGYDISSFLPDGSERLIEVKTTDGGARTPFYISRNELAAAEQNPDIWCLVRVWNFKQAPKMFELKHPLESSVILTPTNFIASFQAA